MTEQSESEDFDEANKVPFIQSDNTVRVVDLSHPDNRSTAEAIKARDAAVAERRTAPATQPRPRRG